jgi:hypothetical protein
MNRLELRIISDAYKAGVDDGFYSGDMREGDDFDTSHPAYREGYDHGVRLYCETIDGEVAA